MPDSNSVTDSASASADPSPSAPRSLLGQYLSFLRSPSLTTPVSPPVSLRHRSLTILRLYSVHLMLVLMVGSVIGLLGTRDSNTAMDVFVQLPAWLLFTLTVIAAPVVEELIFRLPLRATAVNVTLPLSFVALFALGAISIPPLIVFAIALVLLGFNVYLWRSRPRLPKLQRWYQHHPRLLFYGTTLAFGALHITNYDPSVWQLMVLLVLPQTILGLWLGYVRLRYGFGWAVLGHAFHNGFVLSPILLIKIFGSPQLQTRWVNNPSTATLSVSEQLLVVAVSLGFLVGIIVGAITTWRLIQDWRRDRAQPC